MSNPNSLEEILDYAIAMEQAAVELYTGIAAQATSDHNRRLFNDFAQEERGHKLRLEQVKAGTIEIGSQKKILDLKLADYTNDVVITETSSYQEILVFTMKQEKQAYRLYSDLAMRADNEEARALFLSLAQEEANHKLKFELEYDERILGEN